MDTISYPSFPHLSRSLKTGILAFFLAITAWVVPLARAQITFTLTGTANNNNGGYTMGNSYTFVFTTASSFMSPSNSSFSSSTNYWAEEVDADGPLYTSLTGG